MAERWLAEEPGRIDMELCEHDHQMETADPQRLIRDDETSWNHYVSLTTTMNQPERIDDNTPLDSMVPTQSRYLSKTDLPPGGATFTVRGFKREMVKGDDGEEQKTVMHFTDSEKPMILNKVNAELLILATGARTSGEAKGKQVGVWYDPTIMFGARRVGGLRLRAPQAAPAQRQTAPPRENDLDDLDSSIPF